MLTHTPDWPGLTHKIVIHTREFEDLEGWGVPEAIDAAMRKLRRENPGKDYKVLGRHYCQRTDIEPTHPWQLFIGLTEIAL